MVILDPERETDAGSITIEFCEQCLGINLLSHQKKLLYLIDNMDRRQCLVHRWKDKPDATILIECMKALYSKKTNRKGCWIIGKAQGKRIQAH